MLRVRHLLILGVLIALLPSSLSCWCGDGSCNSACRGGINGAPAMPDGFCVWIEGMWAQPDELSHDQACCACPEWGCSESWLRGDLAACDGLIGDAPGPTRLSGTLVLDPTKKKQA